MKYNKMALEQCIEILKFYKYPEYTKNKSMIENNKCLDCIIELLEEKIKKIEEKNLKGITLW